MPKITSKNIPIGVSDFEKLRNWNAVYIDKTPFLKPLLTSKIEVFQFLRPRRFGKTLSMSMLENFLELNYKNPEDRSRQEEIYGPLSCNQYFIEIGTGFGFPKSHEVSAGVGGTPL